MEVRIVSNITKEYPQMIKVLIYKEPCRFFSSDSVKRKREEVDSDFYTPSVSSLNRTKSLVKDLVLCNNFELFCTFTFNPKLCNSFNYGACYHKMSVWLHHQADLSHKRGKKFTYLVIPEKHKSGRWHFHALISGYTGSLSDSKHVTQYGHRVYNITSFRSGFTTAVEVDDLDGVSSYVTKYITKDFIKTFNQRRFFCSRGLVRPVKTINSSIFSKTKPLFRKLVSDTRYTQEFDIFS